MQEGLRAKKELDAYFEGLRTDREARAALKMIKAFIRDRERQDPGRRPPFTAKAPAPQAKAAVANPRKRRAVVRNSGKKKTTARPTLDVAAPVSEPESGSS